MRDAIFKNVNKVPWIPLGYETLVSQHHVPVQLQPSKEQFQLDSLDL